eukprot:CAMPEP_0119521426 /NCGR_PEP_ID=MMETSP1344-20130328/37128_1 /TAXON_ID=236787 /ORGANISM="Florenciella parvula, Strain CCMP2471" /LENGTH=44 /DNA_ID= /DNA_START= /DNA_END= /DNA_ORIENTATION=
MSLPSSLATTTDVALNALTDAHHLSSVQSSSQRDLFAGGRASTS